jgi:glycosyltransferase involved in cell wall biosynthesis
MGKRHSVVAYIRDYRGTMPRHEENDGFSIERRRALRIPGLRSIVDLFRGVRYIALNKNASDIFIAFHLQLAAVMVVLGSIAYGVTSAISPRGEEDFDFKGIFRGRVQKFLYLNCSAILVQSESIGQNVLLQWRRTFSEKHLGRVAGKIHIFPNVVDQDECVEPPAFAPPYEIAFVGRLASYKGVDLLLDAVRMLAVPFHLSVAGEGPERRRLESLAAGMPVQFLGELHFQQTLMVLKKAHVCVLPSLTENLPNAVLEALTAGVPVVATRVGALPEVIRNGWNGYLVAPGNRREIVEAIQKVLSDAVQYAAMRVAARESASKYGPGAIVPQWEHTIREIVQCKSAT